MNIGKYIPDRKIWATGLAGIAAWYIASLAANYGIVLDANTQAQIAIGIGALVGYFIPPSLQDKIKRLDDKIVQIAKNDPNNAVTK